MFNECTVNASAMSTSRQPKAKILEQKQKKTIMKHQNVRAGCSGSPSDKNIKDKKILWRGYFLFPVCPLQLPVSLLMELSGWSRWSPFISFSLISVCKMQVSTAFMPSKQEWSWFCTTYTKFTLYIYVITLFALNLILVLHYKISVKIRSCFHKHWHTANTYICTHTHESLTAVNSVLACGDGYDQLVLKISFISTSQLVPYYFQDFR